MTRIIEVNKDISIGDGSFNIIAGPCSIENIAQLDMVGKFLKKNDIKILRGGIFKPRTKPESFQGLGSKGFEIVGEVKKKYGLAIVSEIMDIRDLQDASSYIDIIQIGARNMYNYPLLKEVGKLDKPVLLKRGLSATIEEWIQASKYITNNGNKNVIMCERGIRTYESYTRNTLDLMAVPIIQKETELPIIVDPSHGTGRKELVYPALKAIRALEADGAMIEIHPNPDQALSDGDQSLSLEEFSKILDNIY